MRALALAGLVTLSGCLTADDTEETQQNVAEERNAAPECNPLKVRSSSQAGDLTGLAPLPGMALPRLGPDAEGFFHPGMEYAEGGTFATPVAKPEWEVPVNEIVPAAPPGTLRAIQWNIARGDKLKNVIKQMKRLNADVWLLNETDIYNKNSGGVVVAREIARALGYSYYTGSEFIERRDDRRAMSGNAIVSRFPLTNARSVALPMFLSEGGFDWSTHDNEPRCGTRSAVGATIEVPAADGSPRRIDLVSIHAEIETNDKVRRKQLDLVKERLVTSGIPAIVAGDLNTKGFREGPRLRDDLKRLNDSQGRESTLFDCSLGNDDDTFSAKIVARARIDWMFIQSGKGLVLDCPKQEPRLYKVESSGGASDHKPVRTNILLK
jgi:endonuclease/exonuclease/phosphatase family metal-dependent hydrolase